MHNADYFDGSGVGSIGFGHDLAVMGVWLVFWASFRLRLRFDGMLVRSCGKAAQSNALDIHSVPLSLNVAVCTCP